MSGVLGVHSEAAEFSSDGVGVGNGGLRNLSVCGVGEGYS